MDVDLDVIVIPSNTPEDHVPYEISGRSSTRKCVFYWHAQVAI